MESFKDRLVTALNIRNMKPVELAEKSGFSKARISQWINGKYLPNSDGLSAIANILKINESWLMGKDVPMDYLKPPEADFQEWEHKYNPNGKLAHEMNLLEEIQKQHGLTTSEAFSLYTQLDSDDQGEIRGEMKHMLKAAKYSAQGMPMLNAAHAIEGASEEDIQHDEDIMRADDF